MKTTTGAAVAAASYKVINLGTLGGNKSTAYGINSAGRIVGSSLTADDLEYATLYTVAADGTVTQKNLGSFNGEHSVAMDINSAGLISGYSRLNGSVRGTLFTVGHGGVVTLQDLGTLGGYYSQAIGINDAGDVVGLSSTGRSADHATYFDVEPQGVAAFDLQNLAQTAPGMGGAYHINDVGQIAGEIGLAGVVGRAGLWNIQAFPVIKFIDLYPDAPPGLFSSAWDLNNAGQVVGNGAVSNIALHAMLFTIGPGDSVARTDLGVLGHGTVSHALGINELGVIVGDSQIDPTGRPVHAFVYAGGVMTDLNLLAQNLSDGTVEGFVSLDSAQAINDAGQIVGNGSWTDGVSAPSPRAFLLNPI